MTTPNDRPEVLNDTNHEPPRWDPAATFEYVPPDDRERPENERRRLIVRYATARDWLRFEEKVENARGKPYREHIETLAAGFEIVVVQALGPDGDGDLLDLFTPAELFEMAQELPYEATISHLQKKSSARRSRSAAANSAATAPADDATTRPEN